jgi:hypothetical protein
MFITLRSLLLLFLTIVTAAAVNAEPQPKQKVVAMQLELQVPAMVPFKPRTEREKSFDFVLPEGVEIDRTFDTPHGLRVASRNLERMTEREFTVTPIDNGVRIKWRVANGEVAPITGRTARLTLELRGTQVAKPMLSIDYYAFRKRLIEQFYFDGLVAQESWTTENGAMAITFADQTIYQGQALAVFATEFALLRAQKGDVTDARSRILEILVAFDRLDLDADKKYGAAESKLDGFFLRDNVSGKDDPRLKGRFAVVESDGTHDASIDMDTPSGDQILGMLFGCWFVCRESGDPVLIAKAKEVSTRLYDYAHRNEFRLTRPDGKLNRRGSEMGWLSTLTHGMNRAITGENRFNGARANIGGVVVGLQPIGTFWADKATPGLLNRFVGGRWEPAGPILPLLPPLNLKSFTLHIVLFATAIDDIWSDTAHEKLATDAEHELAVLVRSRRTGRMPTVVNKGQIDAILAACPVAGPAADVNAATGWSHDNRWIRCSDAFEPTNGKSRYNGLDWMLLHNLNQLVFVGG